MMTAQKAFLVNLIRQRNIVFLFICQMYKKEMTPVVWSFGTSYGYNCRPARDDAKCGIVIAAEGCGFTRVFPYCYTFEYSLQRSTVF